MHIKQFWFKAKEYGYGWYPSSWQGWAVLLMYAFSVTSLFVFANNHTHSVSDMLTAFFPVFYILTVFLLIICYTTGQKPRWQWGSEYYDVLDEKGVPTGKRASYTDVHTKGLWHRAVQVYIINSKNEVLLQKRSDAVELRPNMWDASAAGHVKAGVSTLDAALAEAREELGLVLSPEECLSIGKIQSKEIMYNGCIRNNEFKECFLVYKDIALENLQPEKKEVVGLQWISCADFRKAIAEHNPEFVPEPSTITLFQYLDTHPSPHS
jgi:isopentenyldiphosphate isomerase